MAKLVDLDGLAHVYSIIKGMLADKLGKNDTAVNASKVNNLTVETAVPKNAKFTDTVYTHPSTHPASMITGLSTVATSGSYNDLKDKPAIPTVPTKVSAFINDAGYLTQHQSLDDYAKKTDVNTALANKLGINDTAAAAIKDDAGNTISTTYASKADVSALLSTKLGVTATAYAATRDGAGNNIADTYAKKTDISGFVKTVNGTAPDTNGNVTINVSGGGGSDITVDDTLSATSTNAIQNKAVYNALKNKLGVNGTARYADMDNKGNVISSTYIKSVNNVTPDENGNVTVAVSGGSGVSTSESNTWTAEQTFNFLSAYHEKYPIYIVTGTNDTPYISAMMYKATNNFTLNLGTLAGKIDKSQTSVFSAYIKADADYALTITNAGTLKYIGSASDVAITSAGLLLNIMMIKDDSYNLTSIVQASKLS